jgi:hypothetical protein
MVWAILPEGNGPSLPPVILLKMLSALAIG